MSDKMSVMLYGRLSARQTSDGEVYLLDILPPVGPGQRQNFQALNDWEGNFSVKIGIDRPEVPIEIRGQRKTVLVRVISLHESVETLSGLLGRLSALPAISARICATGIIPGADSLMLCLQTQERTPCLSV